MFKRPLQHIRAERIETHKLKMISDLVEEIWRANQDLLARSDHIAVPVSRKVHYKEVHQALHDKTVQSFDRAPKVTFAEASLAAAAKLFHEQDKSRKICVVNCTSGEFPPATHLLSLETEMYCQTPNLLPSLQRTKPQVLSPFGPKACAKNDLSSFSDVIYSPECIIGRGGIVEEFELYPEDRQAVIPVLSSAAPLTEDQLQYKDKAQEERLLGSIISNRYPY